MLDLQADEAPSLPRPGHALPEGPQALSLDLDEAVFDLLLVPGDRVKLLLRLTRDRRLALHSCCDELLQFRCRVLSLGCLVVAALGLDREQVEELIARVLHLLRLRERPVDELGLLGLQQPHELNAVVVEEFVRGQLQELLVVKEANGRLLEPAVLESREED